MLVFGPAWQKCIDWRFAMETGVLVSSGQPTIATDVQLARLNVAWAFYLPS